MCEPGVSVEIVQVATLSPELAPVPAVREPALALVQEDVNELNGVTLSSTKVTVPVGRGNGLVPATVAVNVTGLAKFDGLVPLVRVTETVGVTGPTTWERAVVEVAGVVKFRSVPE